MIAGKMYPCGKIQTNTQFKINFYSNKYVLCWIFSKVFSFCRCLQAMTGFKSAPYDTPGLNRFLLGHFLLAMEFQPFCASRSFLDYFLHPLEIDIN
jgi:hypothetical protein